LIANAESNLQAIKANQGTTQLSRLLREAFDAAIKAIPALAIVRELPGKSIDVLLQQAVRKIHQSLARGGKVHASLSRLTFALMSSVLIVQVRLSMRDNADLKKTIPLAAQEYRDGHLFTARQGILNLRRMRATRPLPAVLRHEATIVFNKRNRKWDLLVQVEPQRLHSRPVDNGTVLTGVCALDPGFAVLDTVFSESDVRHRAAILACCRADFAGRAGCDSGQRFTGANLPRSEPPGALAVAAS